MTLTHLLCSWIIDQPEMHVLWYCAGQSRLFWSRKQIIQPAQYEESQTQITQLVS